LASHARLGATGGLVGRRFANSTTGSERECLHPGHDRPELPLLDEPAAGIDFKVQQKFYDLIAGWNRETGVTVLLVSHNLMMVSLYANQVMCLRDGSNACEGTPWEILKAEKLAEVYGAGFGAFAHSH
jgi:ABC-type Mn2+/Zn2+ transport system ATPase subunit